MTAIQQAFVKRRTAIDAQRIKLNFVLYIPPHCTEKSKVMKVVHALLSSLRRRPGEIEMLRSLQRRRQQTFIFLVGLFFAIALSASFFVIETQDWNALKIAVPLPTSNWKVLFADNDCRLATEDCPADPSNQKLWNSPLTRSSPDYRGLLRKRQAAPVWIGAHVDARELQMALKQKADTLFLGRIYAPHSIWINGEKTSEVTEVLAKPITVDLRSKEWTNAHGVYIAIEFTNTRGYQLPELTTFELGEIGFIRPSQETSLRNLIAVFDWARPIAFGLANLIIASAFFIFWRGEPVKQEYLFFAGYALVQALSQFVMIPDLVIWLGASYRPLGMNLAIWEATYPLLLGLAFIRARSSWSSWTLVLTLALSSVALLPAAGSVMFSNELWAMLATVVAPICCMLGSTLCLAEYGMTTGLPEKRQYRLLAFSGALAAMGALYAIFGHDVASLTSIAIWHHFSHFVLTALLGAITFSDFNEMAKTARISRLTQFHLNPRLLGKPVSGTVLFFDLKRSEQLMNCQASGLAPSEILHRAMLPFRLTWLRLGGLEINGDGDGVKVFIPEAKATIEKVISELIPELMRTAESVTEILRSDGVSPLDWVTLFRASFAYGSIIPLLETIGSSETAEWQDGANQPFVVTARLLEIEKQQLDTKKELIQILLSESVQEALSPRRTSDELSPLLGSRMSLPGKHGKDWSFYIAKKTAA
jgi:hypothetical protein